MYRFEITKTPPFGYWVDVYDEKVPWPSPVDYTTAWTKKRAIKKAKRIAHSHALPDVLPSNNAEVIWYQPEGEK